MFVVLISTFCGLYEQKKVRRRIRKIYKWGYFEKKKKPSKSTFPGFNTSRSTLSKGLKGFRDEFKAWKAALGMCSIEEFCKFSSQQTTFVVHDK